MYIPPLTPAQAMGARNSTVPRCAGSWMRFASSVSRLGNFFAGELGSLVIVSRKKTMDKAVTTNPKIQNVIRQFHIIIDV